MNGFKNLPETIAGTIAENNVTRLFESLGYTILRCPSAEKNSSYDIVVCKAGKTLRVEVKFNKPGRNIALEYRQRLATTGGRTTGKWVDSGYRLTNAHLYVVENERNKKIHVFEVDTLRKYVKNGWLSNRDSKLCNKDDRNPTVCHVVSYSDLEVDGFFKYIYKKVDDSTWEQIYGQADD